MSQAEATVTQPIRPKYNNAAGRVHEVFKRISQQPDNKRLYETWWEVLNIQDMKIGEAPKHRLFLFNKLSILGREIDAIENEIKKLFPDESEIYLTHIDELRTCLVLSDYTQQTNVVKSHITKSVLNELVHCAKALPLEDTITESEITQLFNKIAQIRRQFRIGRRIISAILPVC